MTTDLNLLLNEKEWRRCFPQGDRSVDELLDAFCHFARTYWHIRHPERGRIKFDLTSAQVEIVRAWLTNRRVIALKARQIGFSTISGCFAFWLAFGWNDRNILMLSKAERESVKLLSHSHYGYKYLPDWMRIRGPLVEKTQQRMSFTSNDSMIESLPSGNDPARGYTAYLVILDEMAFLPNPEEAWASIEPVAEVGGRIICLSTANGEGNIFHHLWQGCQNGTNDFVGLFYPWSAAAGRDQDWYDAKVASGIPDWQMAQEYPSDPDEAFLRSGRPVFNTDLLRAAETVAPRRGRLSKDGRSWGFEEDGGPLRIWEMPTANGIYCLGVDVSEGLEWGDFSSVHVIDCRNSRLVAHWHGHIDPDLLGSEVVYGLGLFYNYALAGVEINNHGLVTLKALQRVGYRNLYRTRALGRIHPQASDSYGWRTTAASKPLMVDELVMAMREQSVVVPCSESIAEMRTFVREGNGKMHGSPHDDRVMSLAIANQMRQHVWLPEYRMEEKAPLNSVMWFDQMLRKQDSRSSRKPIGSTALRSRASM